jgi:hypothetical protein
LAGPGFMTDEMGYEIYRLMKKAKSFTIVVLVNPAKLVFIFSHQKDSAATTEIQIYQAFPL